jgi:hypothetical protein
MSHQEGKRRWAGLMTGKSGKEYSCHLTQETLQTLAVM